ncbi:hypothetical protein C8A01DRAFT_32484 [Parachaetomium inaequale]|uniref:DUF7582 domain-containing protein n=1 Tax=Parachaetomium inaequale TaxID=2588326 RepID=A0AAN6SVA2_9PEZI|nr:hypothetical protein C8A01DRAFT_32484 [Parachaetomium inaequale]
MGQCFSSNKSNAATLLELAPRKATGGHAAPMPNLNSATLTAGLTTVGDYLVSKKKSVTVVAVGGAVNTIFLKSRDSTQDVDFYNSRLTAADFEHLVNGAKAAGKKNPLLASGWLNNHTVFFIPQGQRDTLTDQAFVQNELIFNHPGLKVLAAPWQYAFCCKVDRLSGGGINAARSYDLSDAVVYLHRYLARQKKAGVTLATVQGWFTEYTMTWKPAYAAVIKNVNAAYMAKYKVAKAPIV